MTAAPPRTIDGAIDAAPLGRALITALVACALVMIVDGFDLAAMPMTVPRVAGALGIAPSAFGPALSAALVGMGIGAVLLAPLGDRHGRRPVAIVHLVIIGLATLGTASATTPGAFLVWRLVTGFGLGGCLPNITALTAEITPRRIRARMLTLTGCAASLGGFAAGFLIPPLIAAGGWRAPFVAAGAMTLLLAAALVGVLPESPKFFAARRPDHPRFAPLAAKLGLGDPAAFAAPVAVPGKMPLLALWSPRFRLATCVFAGVYLVSATGLYMLTSWLPTILPRAGFSLDQAARLAGLFQAGGFVGGLAIAIFLDRGKAAVTLIAAYLVVLIALLAFHVVPASGIGWGLLVLIVGGGIAGGHMALMAVGASLYPAVVLTSAIGFAVAVARFGAVGGPMLGATLVRGPITAPDFLSIAALPVLLCIAGLTILPRAQRRVTVLE